MGSLKEYKNSAISHFLHSRQSLDFLYYCLGVIVIGVIFYFHLKILFLKTTQFCLMKNYENLKIDINRHKTAHGLVLNVSRHDFHDVKGRGSQCLSDKFELQFV